MKRGRRRWRSHDRDVHTRIPTLPEGPITRNRTRRFQEQLALVLREVGEIAPQVRRVPPQWLTLIHTCEDAAPRLLLSASKHYLDQLTSSASGLQFSTDASQAEASGLTFDADAQPTRPSGLPNRAGAKAALTPNLSSPRFPFFPARPPPPLGSGLTEGARAKSPAGRCHTNLVRPRISPGRSHICSSGPNTRPDDQSLAIRPHSSRMPKLIQHHPRGRPALLANQTRGILPVRPTKCPGQL